MISQSLLIGNQDDALKTRIFSNVFKSRCLASNKEVHLAQDHSYMKEIQSVLKLD